MGGTTDMFHLTAMHKLLKLILITRVALPGRGGGGGGGGGLPHHLSEF